MAAVALDAYSAATTTGLIAEHGHPGPWNAKWVPTPTQLEAYEPRSVQPQDGSAGSPLSVNVGRNR